MKTRLDFKEVMIIGAGPAGSLAALLLARRGWAVTLIEQHRFPRDKVCGECLSVVGISALKRAGIWPEIEKIGAIALRYTALHAADGSSTKIELPAPMAGISRLALDPLLLDAARKAGARILQPARCESLTTMDGPELRIRDLITNRVEICRPANVIIADGKALMSDRVAPSSNDLGIKVHFANVDGPRDAIELFGCDGCYGGLAPIEGNRWNAAFSIPIARVRKNQGRLDDLLVQLCAENKTLGRRLAPAQRLGPILASPLPRHGVRAHWPDRVVPIGNSAAALEPIGGEGMGLALRSAELAALALDSGSDAQLTELSSHYRSLWRIRRPACRVGGWLASSRFAGAIGARVVGANDAFARMTLKLIGK